LLRDHSSEAALAVTARLVREIQGSRSDITGLRAAFGTLWEAACDAQLPLVTFAIHELGKAMGERHDSMAGAIGCPLLARLTTALAQSQRREDLPALLLQSIAREPNMMPPVVLLGDAATAWIGDDQTTCFLLLDLENCTVTSIHRSLGRFVTAPDFRQDRVVMCPMDPDRAIMTPRNHNDFVRWWHEYVGSWAHE
jgi:hypothetical protein